MSAWALRHSAIAGTVPLARGWSEASGVAGACGLALFLVALGVLPTPYGAAVGVATVHGGLIAVALIWAGVPRLDATVAIALLLTARIAAGVHPAGVVAYGLVPVWLAWRVARGDLRRLGLSAPWPWPAVVTGALAGSALGLHLMTCASRTLGYVVRFEPAALAAPLAYDIGANVLSAELFFRGALFQHLWRRGTFAAAMAAAAIATALRYTLDPFVAATELRVGAAVYMTLLAVLNTVLYRWSGSLLPGLASASAFFACYRLLGKA